jgi:hypothetical protein
MNHFEATKLLDRFKEGTDYPLSIINKALYLTGDIDGHIFDRMDGSYGSAGMDCSASSQGHDARSQRSTQLVDGSNK